MNVYNDARKTLIDEINNAMFTDEHKGCVKPSEIADFIISRERKIVEPLVEWKSSKYYEENEYIKDVVEEVLKRAGLNS